MQNQNKYLFGTVFITGAAVLIIEIAGVRILSPIYGSSLSVLSSVLTVILGALSFGYWYGGRRADHDHSQETLYSIITISGLSVLLLLLLSNWLLPAFSANFSTNTGPLLFSLGLFFAPAFLLGIVSPYIIKIQALDTSTEHLGEVVGATFFWGTFGSIFGSLASGFILIPHLGITKTIILVSFTLIALGLLTPFFTGNKLPPKQNRIFLISTIILIILIYLQTIEQEAGVVYNEAGVYSSITIKDSIINNRTARVLMRNNNASSAIFLDSKELVSPYTKFVSLYESLVPNTKNVLVLGGGAYTIPRTLTKNNPNLNIDVVEIEPRLFSLAQEYFDLSDVSKITNHQSDARVFLRQNTIKKYDVIFDDVFGTDKNIPFHLTTREFYRLAYNNLSPEGVIILNVIGVPKSTQPSLIGSIAKTMHSVFPTVKIYGLDKITTNFQNVIFIARKSELPIKINAWSMQRSRSVAYEIPPATFALNKEILLTDDHSPIEYLMEKQR